MVRMAMPLSEMGFVGLNLADKGEARLGVDELLSSPALSPRMAKLPRLELANLHQIWPAPTAAQTARPHQQRAAMTELPPVGAVSARLQGATQVPKALRLPLFSKAAKNVPSGALEGMLQPAPPPARTRTGHTYEFSGEKSEPRRPARPTRPSRQRLVVELRDERGDAEDDEFDPASLLEPPTVAPFAHTTEKVGHRKKDHYRHDGPATYDQPITPRKKKTAQLPPTFSGRFPRRLDAKLNELRDDPEAFAAFEQHISLLMKEMARAQAAARPPPRKKEKTKKKEAAPEPPAEPEQPVPELATEPLPEPEAPRPGSAPRPDTAPAWDGPAASERPSSATPRKPKKAVRLVEQAAAAATAETPSGPSAAFYDTPEFSPQQQSSSPPKAQEKKKPKEKKKGAGEDNAARREYLKEVKGSSGKEESSEEAAGDASGAANPFLPVLPVGKPRVRRKALAGMISKML